MLWLVISIITSVSFSVGLKISEAGGRDRTVNVFFQYLFGSVVAIILFVACSNRALTAPTVYYGALAGLTWAAAVTSLIENDQLLFVLQVIKKEPDETTRGGCGSPPATPA